VAVTADTLRNGRTLLAREILRTGKTLHSPGPGKAA
jgi:hypothetical protein